MTKHFSKWTNRERIPIKELEKALVEVSEGLFEADLGGHVIKKRIRFQGKGKSKSGRTIICYKQGDRAIFLHGFAKNEKSNLTPNELNAFKKLAKVLLSLSSGDLEVAIKNGTIEEIEK